MRTDPRQSALLVVDIQEKLAPAVRHSQAVIANTRMLVEAAGHLEIPVYFTEHCPNRIGHTVSPLLDAAPRDAIVFTKTHFSAVADPACGGQLQTIPQKHIAVAGTETHVCVLQTVLDLKTSGFEPRLVTDAVSSRYANDKHFAIERVVAAGVVPTTTETTMFEWLEHAEHDAFRAILELVKRPKSTELCNDTGTAPAG